MKKPHNILIVGVGGQGILLASEMLSSVAMRAGYDVKKSEVHGMAQRGGIVSSHVRFGDKIYSPLIPLGQADTLLAFEEIEALRWIHFLKKDGRVIVNRQKLIPPIASLKGFEYPKDPLTLLKQRITKLQAISALNIAEKLNNRRIINIILLGVLSGSLEIPIQIWETAIQEMVPKGTIKTNLNAFRAGREATE